MDIWYTVIQCTVVLGLSPNDTRPYPNTLPIRSILRVNFWVFHPRDLSPFLIHLIWTFTFHYYFIFSSFSIPCTFLKFYFFLHTTMMRMKCNGVNYLIHKYHNIKYKFSTSPNIIEITIIPQFHNFPTTPIIPIIKYNYFLHNKITKNNQINFQ